MKNPNPFKINLPYCLYIFTPQITLTRQIIILTATIIERSIIKILIAIITSFLYNYSDFKKNTHQLFTLMVHLAI